MDCQGCGAQIKREWDGTCHYCGKEYKKPPKEPEQLDARGIAFVTGLTKEELENAQVEYQRLKDQEGQRAASRPRIFLNKIKLFCSKIDIRVD